uniref:Uncharacterized protein n=1 Tax=Lepeophtheirus salmonis TaxID=72036 RepID=A0A0K2TFA7_LEPSM
MLLEQCPRHSALEDLNSIIHNLFQTGIKIYLEVISVCG